MKRTSLALSLLLLSLGASIASPSLAQSMDLTLPTVPASAMFRQAKPKRYLGWQFQEENDALAYGKGNGSDRNYTQGLRYTSFYNYVDLINENRDERSMVPRWIRPSPKLWASMGFGEGTTYHGGIAFGQNLYTPQVISIAEPILDDRPYAAVLYGTHFVMFINPAKTRMNFAEVQIGWTGPPALGYIAQAGVHSLIGDENPNGWKNQIGFEPIVNLTFESNQRVVLMGSKRVSDDNVSADVVPYYSANLGNMMTRANVGVTLRFGQSVAGFPVMNLGSTTSSLNSRKFRWYLFAGADAHLVANNIFLDGNTFQNSQSVKKKLGVYDTRLGFDVVYKDWQLNYTFVTRSDEFSPRPANLQTARTRQNYGSISLNRKVRF